MLLYDSPVSGNCYKVRLLLAQLGLDYERGTERAQVLQWLFFEQYGHEPYLAVVRTWLERVAVQPGHVSIGA